MKGIFSTLCLALAVTIALAAGIRATATPPDSHSVTFVLTQVLTSPTTSAGTFVATGAVEATGTSSMVIGVNGMSIHCVDTMDAGCGNTIVVRLDCSLQTMLGKWRVVSGTGAYAHLKAKGTLVMDFSNPNPAVSTETLIGKAH